MALGVKNWDRHQHFLRRRPTWVKLWHGLLNDKKFQKLPVASRALLPMVWLLASEFDKGIIDLDASEIAWRVHWPEEDFNDALRPCINAGFLIAGARVADVVRKISVLSVRREKEAEKDAEIDPENDLLSKLSPSEQTIIPTNQNNLKQSKTTMPPKSDSDSDSDLKEESIRESLTVTPMSSPKTKTTAAKVKAADVDRMRDVYNAACDEFEVNWPKCQVLSPRRERGLRRLLADAPTYGGVEGWSTMLARAARSSWLNGKTPRRPPHESWKADILYFCRPDVFAEVMEGKHDDRVQAADTAKPKGARARFLEAANKALARGPV